MEVLLGLLLTVYIYISDMRGNQILNNV